MSLHPDSPSVSRPLPTLEVRTPTAERGADDAREHLDGPRCIFCDVPVAEDEQRIELDQFCLRVFRPLCKGHTEHPECWRSAVRGGKQPEKWAFCPICGDPTNRLDIYDGCAACDPVPLDTYEDRYV